MDRVQAKLGQLARHANPIDPNTRILLVGTALVGTAVAIASLLVAKKASASTTTTTTTGHAVSLTAGDAGASSMEAVSVGDTVTISLEADVSAGYSWPAATVAPAGILGPPTRSTSTTGISDTYQVLAPGSATVTYRENAPGATQPTVFNITAAV